MLLYEEYRLIERNQVAINRTWKGAHLLLFFLAFVFGSFCTFCFHMLMYLFDEKCVLFPKLLSLTSLRHNVIYEFIPSQSDLSDLPVDFLSTQWVEKSTCSLPTYVPLVSGIFGLVWTTMFLMCSTGTRTLTGLQRPWRVLPPVFLFSVAMGSLCVYSSAVTHSGLQQLCVKLGEITGSPTCTYTVNVATLTYERRIRGVYQATRLTVATAWLHTACWLCSALLCLVRVILAVDFQLVRISVGLNGDVERMLERHETQIRTISPDETWLGKVKGLDGKSNDSDDITVLLRKPSDTLFSDRSQFSEVSLVPAESSKLARKVAYKKVTKDKQFIVKLLYKLVDNLLSFKTLDSEPSASSHTTEENDEEKAKRMLERDIDSEIHSSIQALVNVISQEQFTSSDETLEIVDGIIHEIEVKLNAELLELPNVLVSKEDQASDNKQDTRDREESKKDTENKENQRQSKPNKRVFISETLHSDSDNAGTSQRSPPRTEVDKSTQTRPKEKQD